MGMCHTVIRKDPDDGWVNLGTYRLRVVDRSRLALHVLGKIQHPHAPAQSFRNRVNLTSY